MKQAERHVCKGRGDAGVCGRWESCQEAERAARMEGATNARRKSSLVATFGRLGAGQCDARCAVVMWRGWAGGEERL